MNKNFEADKQIFIDKIDNANAIIDKILSDSSLDLASSNQISKLRKIQNKNNLYKHKLTSNEFEVAIIGLEKAGKSTFANALIDNNILPSAPERCTFTTTRLVSGEDKAIVKFYNETDFEGIFRGMLKEIAYPDYENVSYRNITLEEFDKHFNDLQETDSHRYNYHVGKTNEEILDIIKCQKNLRLDGSAIEFSGDELNSENFKEYIKGKNGDTSKPRSVESIEIQSSKLQKMQNIIMYDVPGFDSPTKLHERQTEERLKSADAIILVTNAGSNPSIQGTSLNIIKNNTDNDGIALKDKLFVFGNQIDRVNTEDQIVGNAKILRNDVIKHNIGIESRVFTGSALSYLDKNHKPKYKNIDNGIEKIRKALTDYYKTDRFEILKQKLLMLENELKEIFLDIKKMNTIDGDINIDENKLKSEITYQESKEIEKRIKENLKNYFHNLKQDVLNQKWLSKKMEEVIENEKYFKEINDKYFDRIYRIHDESLRLDAPYEKVNRDIRKEIHLKYLEEYLEIIQNITDEKCKEIEQKLLWEFACSVSGSINPTENILRQCEKLISAITHNVAHQKDKFGYLVERFSRDIFDIMLSFPIGSQDRINRFEKAAHDIKHLDYYYSNGFGTLISIILSHKEKILTTEDRNGINKLKNLIKAVIHRDPKNYADIQKISDLIFNNKIERILAENYDIYKIYNYLQSDNCITPSTNQQQVVDEINRDINYLKNILIKSVIPAINLEVAFLNSVDKQIKLLISSIDNKNQHSKVFNNFISSIVTLVKKDDLDNVSQIIEKQKLKKEIIETISNF